MKLWNQSWKYGLIILGGAILILLIMDFNTRVAELRHLTSEKERVSAKVTSLVETKVALETQIAYSTTDASVSEWAYTRGHMVKPGENLVIPLAQAGSTPVATPVPAVTPHIVSTWQVWLSLFVDQPAP
jgi:hypothetical protein